MTCRRSCSVSLSSGSKPTKLPIEDLPPARKSTLVLKADEKSSFGIIIKVMDALKLAGIKNLPAFTQPAAK